MNSTGKFLIATFGTLFVIGGMSIGLATSVSYAPFGVPHEKRAQYEDAVSKIKRTEALRRQADQMGLPQVVVASTRFDFGLIDPHTTASHSFVIRNQGSGPLTIRVAETTCKCTVGDVGLSTLPAGEETNVTLTWNTGRQADVYEQTARVVTNDPTRKIIDLTVVGQVKEDLFVPGKCQFPASDSAETIKTQFYVYSQLHPQIQVVGAESDLVGFDWSATKVDAATCDALVESKPVGVNEVTLHCLAQQPGQYEGVVKLQLVVGDASEVIEREVSVSGRVNAAISFHSPLLHSQEGLDIGTLSSDREHSFHLIVRKNSPDEAELAVLDWKPKNLEVKLSPTSRSSEYRLTVRVPKGMKSTVFNIDQRHGYIQVGNPMEDGVSNWFPVMGAVVASNE